jgi:hypothetical protein
VKQKAPNPVALIVLVDLIDYKDFRFVLEDIDRGQGCSGLTLSIYTNNRDAYHPEKIRPIVHYFPVPAAAYGIQSWTHWIFDRIMDVERHEAMEHFLIDDERPYAPDHGPGHDPYLQVEIGSDERRRTSFRGEVKPEVPGQLRLDFNWAANPATTVGQQ